MTGPGPRAAIRNLLAMLLALLMIVLKFYFQGMPTELVGIIPGVWMAFWGTVESLWDYAHQAKAGP